MNHQSGSSYYYGVNNQNDVYGNNPYVQVTPTSGRSPMDKLCGTLNRYGKRAETLADSVWNHLKVCPSVTDAAMARLTQGTKLLTEGGHDRIFQQQFGIVQGEKLLHSYVCYLSTTTGPVIGTLYISNKKVAFCSDGPLHRYSPTGQPEAMYYKVVLQHNQISAVNPGANPAKPSERYIHIIMGDGYEFWFLGFISYDKALKNLYQASQHAHTDR